MKIYIFFWRNRKGKNKAFFLHIKTSVSGTVNRCQPIRLSWHRQCLVRTCACSPPPLLLSLGSHTAWQILPTPWPTADSSILTSHPLQGELLQLFIWTMIKLIAVLWKASSYSNIMISFHFFKFCFASVFICKWCRMSFCTLWIWVSLIGWWVVELFQPVAR